MGVAWNNVARRALGMMRSMSLNVWLLGTPAAGGMSWRVPFQLSQ